MKDKEVFELFDKLYGPLKYISIKNGKILLKNKGTLGAEWFLPLINIEWSHESKQFPPPAPKYLPIPEWLKRWTHETKVMYPGGFGFEACLLSHIHKPGNEFVFQCSGHIATTLAPYKQVYLGENRNHPEQVTAADLERMNPEELTHIPGHFYKSSLNVEWVDTPTLESLGIISCIWEEVPEAVRIELRTRGGGKKHQAVWISDKKSIGVISNNITIPPGVDYKKCIWARPKCLKCMDKGYKWNEVEKYRSSCPDCNK